MRELPFWKEWFPIFFSVCFTYSSHRQSSTGRVVVTATCARVELQALDGTR